MGISQLGEVFGRSRRSLQLRRIYIKVYNFYVEHRLLKGALRYLTSQQRLR